MNEEQLRRLSDCEVHINKYHDKVDQLSIQYDNYEKIQISKKQMTEDFLAHTSRDFGMVRKDIVCLKEENKLVSEKLNAFMKEHDQIRQEHVEIMKGHKFHVEQLRKDMNISDINHDYHKKDFATLKAKLAEHDKIYSDIAKLKENMSQNNQIMDERIEKALKFIEKLFSLIEEKRVSDNALTSWIQQLKKIEEERFTIFERKFEGHKQDQLSLVNSAVSQINQKIDNLPKPQPVTLADIAPMIQPIQEKVEKALELCQQNPGEDAITRKKFDQVFKRLDKLGT